MTRKPSGYYVGIAIGGPRKGLRMGSPDKVYPLARMQRTPDWFEQTDVTLQWTEIGRGEYHYESGHWWWKGWDNGRV
jgi:hypothetical protein